MMGELVGAYRLMQRLGEGATGEIYLGQHRDSGAQAAVKILFPQMCADAALIEQFFADIKVASLVNHAGIADLFDCGVLPDGRAFVVGEYLQGKTLTDALIALGQVTDVASLADIAWQLATMLGAAHEAGIVHGALKPDAVFLTFPAGQAPRPLVKLVDFGMARFRLGVRQSQTGSLLGAPLYMSPESSRGVGAVDGRADIYSLGCILFEMICGRPPFVRAGAGELIIAHAKEPPPFASSLEPSVPPGIDQLVGRMLTKNPLARPQTMAEVSAVLEHFFDCPTPVAESPRSPVPVFPEPAPGPAPSTPAPVATPVAAPDGAPSAPKLAATAVMPSPSPAPVASEPRRTAGATAILPTGGSEAWPSATAMLPPEATNSMGAASGERSPPQSWLGKVRQKTVLHPAPLDTSEGAPAVRPSAAVRGAAAKRSSGRRSSSRSAAPAPSIAKNAGVSQTINLPVVVVSAAVLLVAAAAVLWVTRAPAASSEKPERAAAARASVAPSEAPRPVPVAPTREVPGAGAGVAKPPSVADPEAPAEPDDDGLGGPNHPGRDKGRPRRFW